MLRIRDQSMTFTYIYIQVKKFHVWSSITSYGCHSSEEDEIFKPELETIVLKPPHMPRFKTPTPVLKPQSSGRNYK